MRTRRGIYDVDVIDDSDILHQFLAELACVFCYVDMGVCGNSTHACFSLLPLFNTNICKCHEYAPGWIPDSTAEFEYRSMDQQILDIQMYPYIV